MGSVPQANNKCSDERHAWTWNLGNFCNMTTRTLQITADVDFNESWIFPAKFAIFLNLRSMNTNENANYLSDKKLRGTELKIAPYI